MVFFLRKRLLSSSLTTCCLGKSFFLVLDNPFPPLNLSHRLLHRFILTLLPSVGGLLFFAVMAFRSKIISSLRNSRAAEYDVLEQQLQTV
jgi:hypothetical protein